MAINDNYKPAFRWDQEDFEKLQASWAPQRVAENEKTLTEIFNLAADVPLLKEALDWAAQHDVKFFIDRKLDDDLGYYQEGTGVLGLSREAIEDPLSAVGTLVHEIRHAWQDYHGLLTIEESDFREEFMKEALGEADAEAFGMRAEEQYEASVLKKDNRRIAAWFHEAQAHEEADLGEKFLFWFKSGAARDYGDDASKVYAGDWGVAVPKGKKKPAGQEAPDDNNDHEFHSDALPLGKGIDINDINDVLRLGVNFSGTKNYLAALQPDILPKKILRPSLAEIFWGAANQKQRKLTAKLRKVWLQEKTAPENRKPRHPWP